MTSFDNELLSVAVKEWVIDGIPPLLLAETEKAPAEADDVALQDISFVRDIEVENVADNENEDVEDIVTEKDVVCTSEAV